MATESAELGSFLKAWEKHGKLTVWLLRHRVARELHNSSGEPRGVFWSPFRLFKEGIAVDEDAALEDQGYRILMLPLDHDLLLAAQQLEQRCPLRRQTLGIHVPKHE